MNLIHRIAKGDREALSKLYEQHKTGIYRLALSLTKDVYQAEDITQETFLRVQEKAETYRRSGSEAAWLFAIARNLAYDSLRRQSRETDINSEEGDGVLRALEEISARESGPDSAAGDLYFLDLLKNLSEREQEVICLRIHAGLSWAEIGRITGEKKDAARKRYVRALLKLRNQLEDGDCRSERSIL